MPLEKMNSTQANNNQERNKLYLDDPLDMLDLHIRPFNALMRSGIKTIGELVKFINPEPDSLLYLRNLGEKSKLEIEGKLKQFEIIETTRKSSGIEYGQQSNGGEDESADDYLSEFLLNKIDSLIEIIKNHIDQGILHKKGFINNESLDFWIDPIQDIDPILHIEILERILLSPIFISGDLEYILCDLNERDLRILVLRYSGGIKNSTLNEIAKIIGVSRERVRQIQTKIEKNIFKRFKRAFNYGVISQSLLRIQSSLSFASDLGDNISFNLWKNELLIRGIIGKPSIGDQDTIDLLCAVCNLLNTSKYAFIDIPKNLIDAMELASQNKPDQEVSIFSILKRITGKERKIISRHARFTGGANIDWLCEEIDISEKELNSFLRYAGFIKVDDPWYIIEDPQDVKDITRFDVFLNGCLKMFTFCGPLPINEICSGIRHKASRTSFPVPPPNVMEKILSGYKFKRIDDEFYIDIKTDYNLSDGEKLMYRCIHESGPVVHHSVLAEAFVESKLSFVSLHKTYNISPLFKRIDSALYTMRGLEYSHKDRMKAIEMAERIPVDVVIEYDKKGKIIVIASLSPIAIGHGSVTSNKLPNLDGSWKIINIGQPDDVMIAAPNEFRQLDKQFKFLAFSPGDRAKFTFAIKSREVVIEKAGRK